MAHSNRQQIKALQKRQFPKQLLEIPDPPKQLYIEGTLPPEETKLLCVVGSRRYSEYGKDACSYLIEGLRGYNIVIISGLALGIDGIAHRAALDAGLKTIAIPGSGLSRDVLYPTSHRNLAEKIIENGGALLSEFETDFRATPYSFPQRNRIMAGLSHAVLVIEAQQRSGTLITARLATEYNRDVLTIPHPLFSGGGEGPHLLQRLGATLIRNSDDILEALHIEKDTEKINTDENLSPEEKKVISLLTEPMTKNDLIVALAISVSEANILLTKMELKKLIHEHLGKISTR